MAETIEYDVHKDDYDMDVYQGEDWECAMTYTDDSGVAVDLSGYTGKMEIREKPGGSIMITLASGSGITLNASGEIGLELTHAQTAALDSTQARYDLKLMHTSGSTITPLIKGNFNVTRQITELT